MADITVNAGGNLQAALDSAAGGDRILLEAGAAFTGVFTFPTKASVVTLTTARHAELPDRRLTPADVGLLPTIVSSAAQAPIAIGTSDNWTLDGLNFLPNPNGAGEVIAINGADAITLRRLVLDVPATGSQRRFITGNGTHITVKQSYGAGIWSTALQDAQFFTAWYGSDFILQDNFAEAAGQSIMFGGADAPSEAQLPTTILVEGNYCTKALRWKGLTRGVKTVFELKAAISATIRNNIFENCWVDAQIGYGMQITPRNQDGSAPWTRVTDITFTRNLIRNCVHGINIIGYDDLAESEQTTNLTFQHLLVLTTGGRLARIANEIGTLTFDHVTYVNSAPAAQLSMLEFDADGPIATSGGGTRTPAFAVSDFTLKNSLLQSNLYGVRSNAGFGKAVLDALVENATYTWQKNVLAGTPVGAYPADTTIIPEAELSQHLGSDYLLVAGSAFQDAATDGGDIGWEGLATVPTPDEPYTPDPDPFPDTEPNPNPEPPDDTSTPDPVPPVVPETPIATVVILPSGPSNAFRVSVDVENPGGVQRIECWIDGVLAATMTKPASGTTYQTTLTLTTAAPRVEVKVYEAEDAPTS